MNIERIETYVWKCSKKQLREAWERWANMLPKQMTGIYGHLIETFGFEKEIADDTFIVIKKRD